MAKTDTLEVPLTKGQETASGIAKDTTILSKLVCKEIDEAEEALCRKSIQFGIADKCVDRLWDVVLSQEAHI